MTSLHGMGLFFALFIMWQLLELLDLNHRYVLLIQSAGRFPFFFGSHSEFI